MSKTSASACRVGEKVMIRTITHYFTGAIYAMVPKWESGAPYDEILLSKAAWVADAGKFGDCLRRGTLGEVEPYPEGRIVSIHAETIIDCIRWDFALPGHADDETVSETQSPCRIGNKVLIRTITHYYTGRIVEMSPKWERGAPMDEIVIADGAWIADTGNFGDCLRKGTFGEVEPYPDGKTVSINAESIVDCLLWSFPLPGHE